MVAKGTYPEGRLGKLGLEGKLRGLWLVWRGGGGWEFVGVWKGGGGGGVVVVCECVEVWRWSGEWILVVRSQVVNAGGDFDVLCVARWFGA